MDLLNLMVSHQATLVSVLPALAAVRALAVTQVFPTGLPLTGAFYDTVVVDGALMSFLRASRSLTEHVLSPCRLMIMGHTVLVIVR